ncbi:NUDIX domain-containing protein [Micromonospora echinofusca]|uniref:NUDIX domain-containing protein n=1 Tax=Micromonospora echinofusca TaxID=47858 RepID=A0ABS3VUU2_MICEH|nr:NUDIX hydrolase [Micromonospora echinofusca]MBO4208311.1 NUDIX domain-containing protein [Micromonospora echinofusca]
MSAAEHDYQVIARVERYAGPLFSVVTDEVTMPGGGTAARDYIRHTGAVGVVALDDAGRVVLLRQYRHPLGRRIWELPAGLTDIQGEGLAEAAARELAEETDLTAGRWDVLVDLHTSPGCSTELVRVFLARDLGEVPAADRHDRHGEEADLSLHRVDLDEAVARVLTGEITNAICVAGLLAAARARDAGWTGLRPADAPVSSATTP